MNIFKDLKKGPNPPSRIEDKIQDYVMFGLLPEESVSSHYKVVASYVATKSLDLGFIVSEKMTLAAHEKWAEIFEIDDNVKRGAQAETWLEQVDDGMEFVNLQCSNLSMNVTDYLLFIWSDNEAHDEDWQKIRNAGLLAGAKDKPRN